MLKWLQITIPGLTAVLLGTGCSSIPQEERSQEPVALSSPSGAKLPAAFVGNDVKAFRSALPAELQSAFSVEKFHALRNTLAKSIGTPVSFRYLTRMEHPLVIVEVWLIRFQRTAEDGKVIHQETLFRVISGILDNKPQIISFNFL